MEIWSHRIKSGFKIGAYLGLAILIVSVGLGCASTHKTTTTETTTTYPNEAAAYEGEQRTTTNVPHNKGYLYKSETTETTTETKTERPGVLSSTLHAIGYVMALPFIIVGGLFRIIFGG